MGEYRTGYNPRVNSMFFELVIIKPMIVVDFVTYETCKWNVYV
jgi:hypothetical protein